MSKTPTKTNESFLSLSQKELSSPYKDNTGVSKTIFTHVSNFNRLWVDWMKIVHEGKKICQTICALKLHEFNEGYYPQQVQPLSKSLLNALSGLKNIIESVEILNNQLQALAKLQAGDTPVTFTWSASKIASTVSEIYTNMQLEYKLKETVTENIAHCRDEKVIELYASSWMYNVYFKEDSGEFLFAELGLPSVV